LRQRTVVELKLRSLSHHTSVETDRISYWARELQSNFIYLKILMPDFFQEKMWTLMVLSVEEPGPLIEWMPGCLVNFIPTPAWDGPMFVAVVTPRRLQPATPSCDWTRRLVLITTKIYKCDVMQRLDDLIFYQSLTSVLRDDKKASPANPSIARSLGAIG